MVLIVAVAVAVPVGIMLTNRGNGTEEPVVYPELKEGESLYYKTDSNGNKVPTALTLAYPEIGDATDIRFIEIDNESGEFGFAKLGEERHFTMYYLDGNGERQVYYPKIFLDDKTVNYTDFFAIETNDGIGRYKKLDYLCLALQTPYFSERIELSENAEERARQLKAYGFAEGEYSSVYFEYTEEVTVKETDESGKEVEKTVTESRKMELKIGEKGISGSYYFTVGDRPYVYSASNDYYNYVTAPYESFIKPLLVAPGLTEDKGFGPYLTTGYYQWKNEVHSTVGEAVVADSKVIAETEILKTVLSENPAFIGYESERELLEIDLKKYSSNPQYKRMINALVGAKNGEQSPNIVFTVTSPTNMIDFGEESSKLYEYTITAIEAILTDSGEITAPGSVCGTEHSLIKVSYTSKAGTAPTSSHIRHAVIDLSSPIFSQHVSETLRAAPIGELAAPLTFTVDYNKDNTIVSTGKYIITEILAIYDANEKKVDKVTETSIVSYKYQVVVDGEVISEDSFILNLAKVTDPTDIAVKNALIGKTVSQNLNISFGESSTYSEQFLNFTTYTVSRIDYFVTSKQISAFKFQNSSDRNPFYGESFYENLMTGGYSLYGLNSSVCEQVVQILGGLSNESSSATAAGLTGDSVVAMGLTPEVMQKYGLYAHSIYFELPRSLYSYSTDNSASSLDDYGYYSTLGFNIYISDVDYTTNTRYIASDMYDIVTRVSADDFVFLNYDFESFWARRNLLLMDIEDVESIKLDFNMSDLGGSYYFDLLHSIIEYQPSKDAEYEEFHKIVVSVIPSDMNQSNPLIAYMKEKGYTESLSLTELYTAIYGTEDPELREIYPDSLGTSYFKEAIQMLYRMTYVDLMPEEDRAAAMAPEKMLMRMTVEIRGSGFDYVYEFYRADDRRILVSMYKVDPAGNQVTTAVSDFYISTFAFKKIVTNFDGLLNGEKINPDAAYIEKK